MKSENVVGLLGKVLRDSKVNLTKSGKAYYCGFTLLTTGRHIGTGEVVDYKHRCVVVTRQEERAEWIENTFTRGAVVRLFGYLHTYEQEYEGLKFNVLCYQVQVLDPKEGEDNNLAVLKEGEERTEQRYFDLPASEPKHNQSDTMGIVKAKLARSGGNNDRGAHSF